MTYDSFRHHRRSIRLKGYDYRQAGAYFVTACTTQRECLFGEIENGQMRLHPYGKTTQAVWEELPRHYARLQLDAFVIMPNHIHGILILAGNFTENDPPLSEIVRNFKAFSARQINEQRGEAGASVWQRDYYEHIIRNETVLNAIRQYIEQNPANWPQDTENPSCVRSGLL